jgi:beta-galactosidase
MENYFTLLILLSYHTAVVATAFHRRLQSMRSIRVRSIQSVCSLILFLLVAPSAFAEGSPRITQDFGSGWKFTWGDTAQAEEPSFDDHSWTGVVLPHDASIAGPIDRNNPSGQGGGFFPTGIVWYRKSFTTPKNERSRNTYVVFDGVMANSDVWINGFHLGHRPNGTVSFYYDLTTHLHPGSNLIAVRCDTSKQPASRWYEGLGIYRPVHLVLTDDIHIAPWSTFVTTPLVSAANATVQVQSDVANESQAAAKVSLQVTLIALDGHTVGTAKTEPQNVLQQSSGHFTTQVVVKAPQLWNLDSPSLYRVNVRVLRAGSAQPLDEEVHPFGIREFHFDAATGFWLNGKNFKVKGAAVHIDGGAVGIAVPIAVWERRLNALRALGVNAIRTAHNPPSPQFLDLCDRMGFLVMDEMFDCWTVGKNPYDYHLYFDEWSLIDLQDTVRRDRNHPSIILYSAGNEIHDTPKTELAHKILAGLVEDFHKNDPTRPVTQALFRPNVSHDYDNGLADMLDVIGQNYREQEILAAHAAKPTRKIIGTENTHDRNQWVAMRDHPEYSGQFLWTGVDYLGEAGVWPLIENASGLVDRTAIPRARGYERQSWWSTVPTVHMARRIAPDDPNAVDPGYETVPPKFQQSLYLDWSPHNTAAHVETVEVYTNCEEVELFLNGTSLGREKLHPDASAIIFKVPFAAGSLKAVAYNHGVEAAHDELRTSSKPDHLVLSTEAHTLPNDFESVATIAVNVVDAAGVLVPDASSPIHFDVTGPAKIIGVDNGSNIDHDSFVALQRKAFQGRAVAILKANAPSGEIHLTASVDGLPPATLTLKAASAQSRVDSPAF